MPAPLMDVPSSSRSPPPRLPIGPTPSTRADTVPSTSHVRTDSFPRALSPAPVPPAHHLRTLSAASRFRPGSPGPGFTGVQPAAGFFRPARPSSGGGPRPSTGGGARPPALDADIAEDGEHGAAPALPFAPGAADLFGRVGREPLLPDGRAPDKRAWRESVDRLFRRLSGSTDGGHAVQPLSFALDTVQGRRSDDRIDEATTLSVRTSDAKARSLGPAPTLAPPAPFKSEKAHDLSAVPVLDARGRVVRRWERHPSQNSFFLGGRVLAGGDQPYAFLGSLALLFGISGTWFGTTCVWWWRHRSPAVAVVGAYMCLLTLSTMLATALRDPGILPRGLDPDPPYPSGQSAGSQPAPLPRDIRVRAGTVRVKYCATCKTYRPPRSSHCKMCDNCVEGCDHHCQWVNNCVGHRNYTSFFAFLASAVLTLALVIVTSAIHLAGISHDQHISFGRALGRGAGSAVAFCLSLVVIGPIGALAVYHIRLLLLNVTTIEQIRNSAHKTLIPGPAPPNPFTHGSVLRNGLYVLCRPGGASWLDAHAPATEDKREVNPAQTVS